MRIIHCCENNRAREVSCAASALKNDSAAGDHLEGIEMPSTAPSVDLVLLGKVSCAASTSGNLSVVGDRLEDTEVQPAALSIGVHVYTSFDGCNVSMTTIIFPQNTNAAASIITIPSMRVKSAQILWNLFNTKRRPISHLTPTQNSKAVSGGGLSLSKKQVKKMNRKELAAHLRSIGVRLNYTDFSKRESLAH